MPKKTDTKKSRVGLLSRKRSLLSVRAKKSAKQKKSTKKQGAFTAVSASVQRNASFVIAISVFFGLLFLGTAGYLWYDRIYSKADAVFWGMVEQNLSTPSVTRTVLQNDSGIRTQESTQMIFGEQTGILLHRQLSQTSDQGTTKINVEAVGTTKNDYQRYSFVQRPAENGKTFDYKPLYDKWVQTNLAQNGGQAQEPQLFDQALLNSMIFGNMTPAQRHQMIQYLRRENVYDLNKSSAQKTTFNGRRAIRVEVNVSPRKLAGAIKKYGDLTGIASAKNINVDQYGQVSFVTTVIVDVASRQLKSVTYSNANVEEQYASAGVRKQLVVPNKTIDISSFTQILSDIER